MAERMVPLLKLEKMKVVMGIYNLIQETVVFAQLHALTSSQLYLNHFRPQKARPDTLFLALEHIL